MAKTQIEPLIFWPSLILVLLVSFSLILIPGAETRVASALTFINHAFDWLFLTTVFAILVLLVWLALGRYGNVKLGDPNDKPEFSTFSWISMLFNAGIGSSLFYWAMVEPIYYVKTPPFGITSNSKEALEWAVSYGMFHWGFSGWATYAIPAIVIAYSLNVKKIPLLRPSVACEGILGKRVDGWMGKLIDIIIAIGLVGGIGTALGINVPMVSALVCKLIHLPDSLEIQILILVIWTSLFGLSAYLGVNRGIKVLSDLNSIAAILFLLFVLLVGPTLYILSSFSNSIGLMLNNFLRMSFYTDPILKSGFPQTWTVFYWSWWITFAVYMGMFVARVSKGRTIKELVVAEVICGSLGCFVFFAVFGGYAIYLQSSGAISLTQMMSQQGPTAVIVTILSSLPLSKIILPVFILISIISQATGIDAAAYTLAAISTKKTTLFTEPTPLHRLFWAIVLGTIAAALLIVGGLKVVQLSSVVVAVPVLFIMYLFIFSLLRWLKEDNLPEKS